jgi:hypothetical protein
MMKPFEDFEEDQTTSGWTQTPIPADHFSLSPEWQAYKASLSETVPADAPEVSKDWYGHASGLAGRSTDEETI